MAEESQDGQEKTEEPSQRKLEKAAEDGKVLSSKEAFVFTSMFAGFMLMFITPMFLAPLLDDWGAMFHFERPNVRLHVSIQLWCFEALRSFPKHYKVSRICYIL